MRCALKEMRSVQEAEIPGSRGLHMGRAPVLQMLASTCTSELLFFVLFFPPQLLLCWGCCRLLAGVR